MVSFHESISSNQKKMSNQEFFENSSEKKRRWGDREEEENFDKESNKKQSKGVAENATKSLMGIEFHLETPSSVEDWKQCLDIQSGEVHFYNTRNQKITYKDPRQQQQQLQSSTTTDDQEKLNLSNHHMSLELELNLPCQSLRTHMDKNNNWSSTKCDATKNSNKDREISKQSSNSSVKRCPSWMSFEADQQEMVAAACMRCHMLVMLCKSSPSCPNCKFMHPPDHHQSPSNMFKPRRFSPLHCKD